MTAKIINYSRFFRHYSLTVLAILVFAGLFLTRYVFHIDLFVYVAKELEELDNVWYLRREEEIFSVFMVGVFFVADHLRLLRRNKRKRDLQAERLAVARSTLSSVHDVVNNSLNTLLLVKLEAEKGKPLSSQTQELFGNIIDGLASELRSMSETDIISKRDLSQGISVLDRRKSSD